MAADSRALDFRVLGPLEVVVDGEAVALGGLKQRALLALLVMHPGEVLATDRLVDELWGEMTSGSGGFMPGR